MKIALIGNMNNSNFALLRYFFDLGHETHLYLYENDGINSGDHFSWTNDTWNKDKWEPFIFSTPIVNGHLQVFSSKFILYIFSLFFFKIFKLFNLNGKNFLNPGVYQPGKFLDDKLHDYDFIIGSGISPALFTFCKRQKLDLFYPYSTGVEYYFSPASTTNLYNHGFFSSLIKRIVVKVSKIQAKGIIQTNLVFNAELSLTKVALKKLKKPFYIKPIPLLYLEGFSGQSYPEEIKILINKIKKEDFSILMTSRQFWVPPELDKEKWIKQQSKNNHWLIHAFKKFNDEFPDTKNKLFIVEYGKDVKKTKDLILELEIHDRVIWVPKLPRKWILILLKHVNVSIGEFYHQKETIWGGTAIEALACGVPFINSLKFQKEKFFKDFGYELPPILNANSIEDIKYFLIKLYKSKEFQKTISDKSIEWYKKNNGLKLAQDWLSLLIKNGTKIIN